MDIVRGIIVTKVDTTIEIRVPGHKARLPGWTRLEAAGKVLLELGIEIEGANRVEIKPDGEGHSLMIWHEYPERKRGITSRNRL